MPRTPSKPERIDVVAAFYPLQFVAEQVGGDAVAVTNLTPAGAEPHELELSARDAGRLQDADLVVYLDGFAPALDDAIHDVDAAGFDVTAAADLDRATNAADDDDGRDRDETGIDPHFWLDPLRLAAVGDAVAAELGSIDPGRAAGVHRQRRHAPHRAGATRRRIPHGARHLCIDGSRDEPSKRSAIWPTGTG